MNQTRPLLIFALCVVAYLLWNQWQQQYAPQPAVGTTASEAASPPAPSPAADGLVPTPRAGKAQPTPPTAPGEPATATVSDDLLVVENDVLRLSVDLHGGGIVKAELKQYPVAIGSSEAETLLSPSGERFYVAETGLVSADSPVPTYRALFQAGQATYRLAQNQNELSVELRWQGPQGIQVVKRYVLHRGSYVVEASQTVVNGGDTVWTGNAYRQLQRVIPPQESTGLFGFSDPSKYSFFGAGWFGPEEKFQKLAFDEFTEEPLDRQVTGGWLAMLQHYFFAAWIPPAEATSHFSSHVVSGAGEPRYLVRASAASFRVAPGASGSSSARLYLGPKLADQLEAVAPDLDLAVDYGLLTVIAQPLHWVLSKFHALIGNWGVAIILLVLLIKLLFFKLSEAQYRSMAKMRKLTPRIQSIKERFADDRSKQQQAMLDLYKKEKANPMAGCLPMLVQMPVFFALYYVLMQSVELRQAPFMLWINDLSAPDPLYVLPILNGAVMLGAQFLTPAAGMDPMQAKIMKFMPVIFAVMFALFPSGLVLYYVVNGLLGLIQQFVITKRMESHELHKT